MLVVPVLPRTLQRSAGRRARSVPLRPATASEARNGPRTFGLPQSGRDHLHERGRRQAVEAREAGAVCDRACRSCRRRRPPAPRSPLAPPLRSSQPLRCWRRAPSAAARRCSCRCHGPCRARCARAPPTGRWRASRPRRARGRGAHRWPRRHRAAAAPPETPWRRAAEATSQASRRRGRPPARTAVGSRCPPSRASSPGRPGACRRPTRRHGSSP